MKSENKMKLNEVWLVDYARTAFSRSRPIQPDRDVFSKIRGDELLAQLLIKFFDEKLADKGITRNDIEEVSVGVASGVLENWTYGGKIPLFLAGFPNKVSSFFIDKQCASAGAGMHMLTMEVMTGYTKCALATGFEHMTRVRRVGITPAIERYKDKNSKFYHPEYDMENSINMLQTAQRLYEEEVPKFTKEDLDRFGVRSHNLTIESQENKWFTSGVNGGEIVPIEGHVEGNPEVSMIVDRDMTARKSTLEGVSGLRRISTPFYLEKNGGKTGYIKREGTAEGVITAGNSSPLNAGATTAVLMEAKEAKMRNLDPMARIISIGWAGVDPRVMGRGPVPATHKALESANLTSEEIDFWEINEAFSIVALNCMDKFNIPEEKVNIKGGSTAIGHPLGATMIRLTGTLARILREKKGRYGVACACVGGGQGLATIIENVNA